MYKYPKVAHDSRKKSGKTFTPSRLQKTEKNLTMRDLLSLSQELRDMITEYVLTTPEPGAPIRLLPRKLKNSSPFARVAFDRNKKYLPLQPIRNPLLRTNSQLRAKVQQRASIVQIPLVL